MLNILQLPIEELVTKLGFVTVVGILIIYWIRDQYITGKEREKKAVEAQDRERELLRTQNEAQAREIKEIYNLSLEFRESMIEEMFQRNSQILEANTKVTQALSEVAKALQHNTEVFAEIYRHASAQFAMKGNNRPSRPPSYP